MSYQGDEIRDREDERIAVRLEFFWGSRGKLAILTLHCGDLFLPCTHITSPTIRGHSTTETAEQNHDSMTLKCSSEDLEEKFAPWIPINTMVIVYVS